MVASYFIYIHFIPATIFGLRLLKVKSFLEWIRHASEVFLS